MNQSQLVQKVLEIVDRPDRTDLIRSTVRASIIRAHSSGWYYKDIVEQGVRFLEEKVIQNFDPKDIFGAGFRKISYVRKWHYDPNDIQLGRPGNILEPIQIRQVLDEFGFERSDVYYMSGKFLQIRCHGGIKYCLSGAYVLPDLSHDNTSSWICEEFPDLIINDSAAEIMASTGLGRDAQFRAAIAADWKRMLLETSDSMPGR